MENLERFEGVIEGIDHQIVNVRIFFDDREEEVVGLERSLIRSGRIMWGNPLNLWGTATNDGYVIHHALVVEPESYDPVRYNALLAKARTEIGPELPELPPIKDE